MMHVNSALQRPSRALKHRYGHTEIRTDTRIPEYPLLFYLKVMGAGGRDTWKTRLAHMMRLNLE
jgi:hypothetical protein